jgi:hypothetical protein
MSKSHSDFYIFGTIEARDMHDDTQSMHTCSTACGGLAVDRRASPQPKPHRV